MTIEENWTAVEAERLRYGLAMAREDAETVGKRVELDRSAVRAAMLTAHVDACAFEEFDVDGEWRECGQEGWRCEIAKRIEELT